MLNDVCTDCKQLIRRLLDDYSVYFSESKVHGDWVQLPRQGVRTNSRQIHILSTPFSLVKKWNKSWAEIFIQTQLNSVFFQELFVAAGRFM